MSGVGRCIYLDTSALRGRPRDVRTAASSGALMYTGALFAVEILNSFRRTSDARQFGRAAAASRLVADGTVTIDVRLPEEFVFSAFEALRDFRFVEDRVPVLRRLLEVLAEASDARDFERRAGRDGLDGHVNYFRDYDALFGVEFVAATVNGHAAVRQAFTVHAPEQARVLEAYGVPANASFGEFSTAFGESPVNFMLTIESLAAFALQIATDGGVPEAELPTLERVADSYDGSIDTFVRAMSVAAMEYVKKGGRPGRNDALDLHHFCYATPRSELWTSDEGMARTARAAGWPCEEAPRRA